MKESTLIQSTSVNARSLHKLEESRVQSECFRCGGRHQAEKCYFKEKECFKCKKRGHTTKKCRSKDNSCSSHKKSVNLIENSDAETEKFVIDTARDDDIFNLYPFEHLVVWTVSRQQTE